MANLADSLQRAQFVKKLEACEKYRNHLTDSEYKFIEDMREKFDGREDDTDMGLSPWNPTSSQLNWLSAIAGRL